MSYFSNFFPRKFDTTHVELAKAARLSLYANSIYRTCFHDPVEISLDGSVEVFPLPHLGELLAPLHAVPLVAKLPPDQRHYTYIDRWPMPASWASLRTE